MEHSLPQSCGEVRLPSDQEKLRLAQCPFQISRPNRCRLDISPGKPCKSKPRLNTLRTVDVTFSSAHHENSGEHHEQQRTRTKRASTSAGAAQHHEQPPRPSSVTGMRTKDAERASVASAFEARTERASAGAAETLSPEPHQASFRISSRQAR